MSMALAKQAMECVWKRWGTHIPSELREYEARDVFVFHTSEDAFLTSFSPTFEKAFQPANAWLKGMSARDCASDCAAFSTAHITHSTRKLHISPKGMSEPEPVVLMAHEYLHWLSHEAFYPSYYKQGGNRPFQVEGITEWLTIQCFPPGQATVVYRDEYTKTVAWVGSDKGNERRMLDFIFKGKATNLDALHP